MVAADRVVQFLSPWRTFALCLGLAVAWFVLAARDNPVAGASQSTVAVTDSCPYNWGSLIPVTPAGDVWIAGKRSNIPEFHDCQRLVVKKGVLFLRRPAYGPLVGVFVSQRIEDLPSDLDSASFVTVTETCVPGVINCSPGGLRIVRKDPNPDPTGIAVVQVYNFSSDPYKQLGLGPQYNCLYLTVGPGNPYSAWMLKTGSRVDCPVKKRSELKASAKLLTVLVDGSGGSNARLYPPVARLDMDAPGSMHTIGIKCGAAWCEIGNGSFSASTTHGAAFAAATDKKVFAIKGWYDEQVLAVYDGGGLRYTGVKGVVVPFEHLDTLTTAHVMARTDTGVPAYRVYMSKELAYYRDKLGFARAWPVAPGTKPNVVWLKHNGVKWSAVVRSANGDVKQLEIYHHDHSALLSSGVNFVIPGTTRFRWVPRDETTWAKCDYGCCSTNPT